MDERLDGFLNRLFPARNDSLSANILCKEALVILQSLCNNWTSIECNLDDFIGKVQTINQENYTQKGILFCILPEDLKLNLSEFSDKYLKNVIAILYREIPENSLPATSPLVSPQGVDSAIENLGFEMRCVILREFVKNLKDIKNEIPAEWQSTVRLYDIEEDRPVDDLPSVLVVRFDIRYRLHSGSGIGIPNENLQSSHEKFMDFKFTSSDLTLMIEDFSKRYLEPAQELKE